MNDYKKIILIRGNDWLWARDTDKVTKFKVTQVELNASSSNQSERFSSFGEFYF